MKLKINDKDKRITIGQFPEMSLAKARDEFARLKAEIRKSIDPTVPVVPDKKITFGEITKNILQWQRSVRARSLGHHQMLSPVQSQAGWRQYFNCQ